MINASPGMKQLPLDIVGSTSFGRYPKISVEQTYNMIISDGFMVPFAGYNLVTTIDPAGQGRGIYSSTRLRHLVVVIDNGVYIVDKFNVKSKIGEIDTHSGDVFIDENNASEIAICDKQHLYIYNYSNNTFVKATLDFTPGYIAFQNGYFIAPATNTNRWRLSAPNNGLLWPADAASVGALQTKPDYVVAAVRIPGKGNLLHVFGSTVAEPWYFLGYNLFPYQRSEYANIDFGCLNPATIASNDNIVCWLGGNEKSGTAIMVSDGGEPRQISNDGINFKLAELTNPANSYGFLFKQDGHTFYQLSFPDDSLSYIFDFNTEKFFTVSDENMGMHIAKRVAFFNNSYYFVSFTDGNLYELGSQITTYNGNEIPRVRVCKSIRLPDQSRFVVNNVGFTLEQGTADEIQRIDCSVSRDGGQSFGNDVSRDLNPLGKRKNKLDFWNCGMANDFTLQFRFWGHGRFVATNGTVSYYQ